MFLQKLCMKKFEAETLNFGTDFNRLWYADQNKKSELSSFNTSGVRSRNLNVFYFFESLSKICMQLGHAYITKQATI